jgi:integrase
MRLIGNFGDLTLHQARKRAQEWWGIKSSRRDVVQVLAERDREAVTVADVVNSYLEDFRQRAATGAHRGKRSSYVEAERLLTSHVLPRIGRVPARSLTIEQVRTLHRNMSGTPGAANRVLTALGAALAFGQREGLVPVGHNPCRNVERFRENGSRRALTREELQRLGAKLTEAATSGAIVVDDRPHKVHPSVILAIRLAALTGLRRGELLGSPHAERRGDVDGLRWGDVDLDTGLVTLQDSKTGPQLRVLGQAAVEVLCEAKPKGSRAEDCVCPGATDRRTPYRAINAARRLLWKAAGLPLERGCDLHSLRHSFASIGAHTRDGRYAGLVSALLGHGHQSKQITRRYITEDPELLRPAADAVAGEIAALLGLEKLADVVTFPSSG